MTCGAAVAGARSRVNGRLRRQSKRRMQRQNQRLLQRLLQRQLKSRARQFFNRREQPLGLLGAVQSVVASQAVQPGGGVVAAQ